jgi:HAD superfamily hydrolase (TIGR01509 family)
MQPALVIFDCDGVLVDSEPIANRVLAAHLTRAGLPTTEESSIADYVGLSLPAVLAEAARRLGRPLPADFAATLQTETFAAFRAGLRPVDGIAEALDALPWPACVASSGAIEKMRVSLGVTGLWDRFEGRIFSAAQVRRGKPFPDLFLHAAASLGADPAACVVVEDSRPGVLAARAAGMAVLGYVGGITGHALADAGAIEFTDMRDLGALIASL